MLKQIRVDREKMAKGEPCILVRREDGVERCYTRVEIMGPSSIKSLVVNPELAQVWVETESDVIGLPDGEML